MPTNSSRKLKAAKISIAANLSLIAVKVIVAIFTGSIAILAEVLHSMLDLLASGFAYIGIQQASKPEDDDHPYGHERFENLSSLIQTLLIVITSIFIFYEVIHRFSSPHQVESVWWALAIMIVTLVVDIGVSRYLHNISSETESAALEADAYHFTTDLWAAVAVIVGLFFTSLGYPVFDSIAAVVVAIMMLWVSQHLGRKSLNVLLDKSPSKEVKERLQSRICKVEGVLQSHGLRLRQSGSIMHADVNIHVDPQMTVLASHELAHEVKRVMQECEPSLKDVVVHIEPQRTDELRLNRKN